MGIEREIGIDICEEEDMKKLEQRQVGFVLCYISVFKVIFIILI